MTDRKNGGTTGHDVAGHITHDNPGRPTGSRHKATMAALVLLDGEAEALTRKAIDLALAGDVTALRLCLERIIPPRKEAPVTFALPDLETAASAVLNAVATGELTIGEALQTIDLVKVAKHYAPISFEEPRPFTGWKIEPIQLPKRDPD